MCDYSQITDNIFIGNAYSVIGCYRTKENDILDILNIKTVISALTEWEYEDYIIEKEDFIDIDWHRLIMDDDEEEKISQYFFDVYSIIRKSLSENKKVMVHCAAGMSRSPTLVIAYLMIENGWGFNEAFKYVKNRRDIVDPNDGFVKQLKALEYKLKSYNKYI
jgi:protein-tyrosine phosphatase